RSSYGTDRAIAIDQGLRAYMVRVYNLMAGGIAFTGIAAWLTYQMAGGSAIQVAGKTVTGLTPFGQMVFGGIMPIVLMLVTLGLVVFVTFRIHTLQTTNAV